MGSVHTGIIAALYCCLFFLFFFLIITFTFQLNSQEVLPSEMFWTSRGHRCRPFSPPLRAFNFYRAQGSVFPLLVDFHRMVLTHALALSANNFFMQEQYVIYYLVILLLQQNVVGLGAVDSRCSIGSHVRACVLSFLFFSLLFLSFLPFIFGCCTLRVCIYCVYILSLIHI